MIASTAVQPPPPGIRVTAREDAVELAIARPGRVRRALVWTAATGIGFAVAAVATAVGSRAPKEPLFVVATFLFAGLVGSIRAVVLARRPVRLAIDADHLAVTNARPWSMQNVVLARARIGAIEPIPNGIAARLRDGRLVPIVRELGSEEAAFVEAILHSAAASAPSSIAGAGSDARAVERSFASST